MVFHHSCISFYDQLNTAQNPQPEDKHPSHAVRSNGETLMHIYLTWLFRTFGVRYVHFDISILARSRLHFFVVFLNLTVVLTDVMIYQRFIAAAAVACKANDVERLAFLDISLIHIKFIVRPPNQSRLVVFVCFLFIFMEITRSRFQFAFVYDLNCDLIHAQPFFVSHLIWELISFYCPVRSFFFHQIWHQ